MIMRRRRLGYGIAFFLLILTEVGIALFVHDGFLRPYVGDVLAALALYTLARVLFPQGIVFMPAVVFAFCVLVEVLQYFQLVSLLHLEQNAFFRILLGATFDWRDVLCYLVGSLFAAAWEIWLWRREKFPDWPD